MCTIKWNTWYQNVKVLLRFVYTIHPEQIYSCIHSHQLKCKMWSVELCIYLYIHCVLCVVVRCVSNDLCVSNNPLQLTTHTHTQTHMCTHSTVKLAKVVRFLWGLWLSPCLSCLQSSMEDKGAIAHPQALISKGVRVCVCVCYVCA